MNARNTIGVAMWIAGFAGLAVWAWIAGVVLLIHTVVTAVGTP